MDWNTPVISLITFLRTVLLAYLYLDSALSCRTCSLTPVRLSVSFFLSLFSCVSHLTFTPPPPFSVLLYMPLMQRILLEQHLFFLCSFPSFFNSKYQDQTHNAYINIYFGINLESKSIRLSLDSTLQKKRCSKLKVCLFFVLLLINY